MTPSPSPSRATQRHQIVGSLLYVAVVLSIDALATSGTRWPIDWRMFVWMRGAFDIFKFTTWLVIPLVWSLREFDWGYYGWTRWTPADLGLCAALVIGGIVAVALIPNVPGVNTYYRPRVYRSAEAEWRAWARRSVWTISWLPGWELLHRYVLLRRLRAISPVFAVITVALFEGVYHLQKPLLECIGMVLLSIMLSSWAVRRVNGLLPLVVHASIEAALSVFMIV